MHSDKSFEEFINDIKGKDQNSDEKKMLENLLARAYDIRKFELELYWKRGTYFWTFIAASFTAYFIVAFKQNEEHHKFLVICIGFVFSLAWYLVNRGSGYWTTHWERVIDAIETKLGTELYKYNLNNRNHILKFDKYFPHSVSRINIAVSLFICIIWIGLMISFLWANICNYCINGIDPKILLPLILTTGLSIYLFFFTESDFTVCDNGDKYSFYKRNSEYKEVKKQGTFIKIAPKGY